MLNYFFNEGNTKRINSLSFIERIFITYVTKIQSSIYFFLLHIEFCFFIFMLNKVFFQFIG